MPNLRPFRDISEHFVLNLFSYSGTPPVNKGTFVKVWQGWSGLQSLVDGGAVGGFQPQRTVSRRYVVPSQVTACTSSGDACIGVTMYDVRELDENGVPLIFNKQKQAQLQAVLSGESVPIIQKGILLYSGALGAPTGGQPAYLDSTAVVTSNGSLYNAAVTRVGTFLGPTDANGWTLVKIDL